MGNFTLTEIWTQAFLSCDDFCGVPNEPKSQSASYLSESAINYQHMVDMLDYNPSAGLFTWYKKNPRSRAEVGSEAGSQFYNKKNGKSYRLLCIQGRYFYAHRIAYLWVMGKPASGVVDHKDGNSLNNRWDNLREASKSQDNWNKGKQKNNKTGFKGVCRYRGRYLAQIAANGKSTQIGVFDTPEEAHAAYVKAAKNMHRDFANTGERDNGIR